MQGKLQSTKTVQEGEYTLTIESYLIKEGCWCYTRCIVQKDNEFITEIERNYSSFPYLVFKHNNGHNYLICGEKYMSTTIVNLDTQQIVTHHSPGHEIGAGFCSYEWYYEECDDTLIATGCFWGGPEKKIEYQFTNPESENFIELSRWNPDPEYYDDYEECDEEDE